MVDVNELRPGSVGEEPSVSRVRDWAVLGLPSGKAKQIESAGFEHPKER
jgi:hypothetical protein